jgi:hypothetical protein
MNSPRRLLALCALLTVGVALFLYVQQSDVGYAPRERLEGGESERASLAKSSIAAQSGSAASEREIGTSFESHLPRGFDRVQQLERAGYESAGNSMNVALERLQAVSDRFDRAALLRGIFTAAAGFSTREALAFLKTLQSKEEQMLAMQTLATAWRGGSPPASAFAAYPGLASGEARLGLSLLDETSAGAELSIAWAEELVGEPTERAILLGAAAQILAHSDPTRALVLAATLPEQIQHLFQGEFARRWYSASDPAEAWSVLEQMPAGELRNTAQSALAAGWAAKAPHDALSAVGGISADGDRQRLLASVAESWAGSDTAAAIAAAQGFTGEDRAALERGIQSAAPVGIGARLNVGSEGYPVVEDLLAGGSAARSGSIPAGSVIIGVTDASGMLVDTKELGLESLVQKVRGTRGSRVTLMVRAPGKTEAIPVELIREQIIRKAQ